MCISNIHVHLQGVPPKKMHIATTNDLHESVWLDGNLSRGHNLAGLACAQSADRPVQI